MSNTFFINNLWLSVVYLLINSSKVNAIPRDHAFIRYLNGWAMV